MAISASEIARLEQAVRDAQMRLDAARRENARADESWARMCREADANIKRGKAVDGAFITGAAERARAAQGISGKVVEKSKVVPLHRWRSTEHFTGGFYDPSQKDKK
jgi:hypothetical protein